MLRPATGGLSQVNRRLPYSRRAVPHHLLSDAAVEIDPFVKLSRHLAVTHPSSVRKIEQRRALPASQVRSDNIET